MLLPRSSAEHVTGNGELASRATRLLRATLAELFEQALEHVSDTTRPRRFLFGQALLDDGPDDQRCDRAVTDPKPIVVPFAFTVCANPALPDGGGSRGLAGTGPNQ